MVMCFKSPVVWHFNDVKWRLYDLAEYWSNLLHNTETQHVEFCLQMVLPSSIPGCFAEVKGTANFTIPVPPFTTQLPTTTQKSPETQAGRV